MLVWHRMLLRRGRNGLLLTAVAAAGVWVGPTAALAQAQQPGQRPGPGEWFRDDVPASPAGGGATPVGGAAPADVPPAPPVPSPPAPPAPAPAGVVPPAGVPAAARPYRMPPMGGGGYGNPYGSVSGLYPSSEMNSYVTAMARAATARALFRLADSELGQAFRGAQRQFDNSAEYKAALREEKDAYEALTAARAKALSSLSGDSKYQRLLALRQDLSERLDDLRARRAISQDEVVAMANLKMSYATEMRVIEAQALNNEGSVKQSQDRLVAAGTRLTDLRQNHGESLRVNPDVVAARRNLEDARIAKLTAEAYLYGATVNGSYALDYSYYLYRTPRSGYGSNGYYGTDYGGTYAGNRY
jgi:hypothetical protein